ncbi:hypothetical protein [Pseudomonas turukhanskensis]|uniref:PH domain-containing protein n=1 Tax=Pseudomonas turukhanskensis TaxID=1806536 RepID=A0A9W6K7Z6_9PSED|nr:hypothetical protein [Pseudomonas turukhanskensis]GLK89375.1 hypothetical protein GCM10017655_24370 [Pseudomonas turukhanskensis]
MDLRLLTLPEIHKVHFYRLITLVCLSVIGVMTVFALLEKTTTEAQVFALVVLVMLARFGWEWVTVSRCTPVFVLGDELVLAGEHGSRRVPLTQVREVTSRHAIFMTRRYRSWSEHLAFMQLTLATGERIFTLAESGVFEFPAGKITLAALQAVVLEAKTRSLTASAR